MYYLSEGTTTIDGTEFTTYGIKSHEVCIGNISANKTAVMDFIEICNKYELAPIHLHDAVSDFIAVQ